jgi:hypothetical protein
LAKSAERGRILTFGPRAVNSRRGLVALVGCLALLVAGAWPAGARAVPTRGELRLLVVLAGFPDRPLGRERARVGGGPTGLVERRVTPEVPAGGSASSPGGAGAVTVPRGDRGRPSWHAMRSWPSPPPRPIPPTALRSGTPTR